jgi:parallel beta-helix repeat protein
MLSFLCKKMGLLKKAVFFLLLVGSHELYAATTIDNFRVYAGETKRWTTAGSPYTVNGQVEIEYGGKLIIEKGVEVVGNGRTLYVGGALSIEGVDGSSTDTSKKVVIDRLNINAADYGTPSFSIYGLQMSNGNINFSNSQRRATKFELKNSILTKVSVYGEYLNGPMLVEGTTFGQYSQLRCNYCEYSTVTIKNNTFASQSYGVELYRNYTSHAHLITGNTFNSSYQGIYLYYTAAQITGNTFRDVTGSNVIYSRSYEVKVEENEFYNSGPVQFSNASNTSTLIKNFFSTWKKNSSNESAVYTDNVLTNVDNNMFCANDQIALRLEANTSSKITAGVNYWNLHSSSSSALLAACAGLTESQVDAAKTGGTISTVVDAAIRGCMIWDSDDDLNVKNQITFSVPDAALAPWLTTAQRNACAVIPVSSGDSAEAKCTLSGTLSNDRTLSKAECPSGYAIDTTYGIGPSATLSVGPGVKISAGTMQVAGSIRFSGTTEAPISLTSVYFATAGYATPSMTLDGVIMTSGGINFSNSQRRATKFELKNSILTKVSVYGEYLNGPMLVEGTTFGQYSQLRCNYCEYSTVTIKNNTFASQSYGVELYRNYTSHAHLITGNTFNSSYQGIYLYYTAAEISGNTFKNVTGNGIYFRSYGQTIENNVFVDSAGIDISYANSGDSIKIENNSFCRQRNNFAIRNQSDASGFLPAVKNNNFCSTDRVALALNYNRYSAMLGKNNYWNTGSDAVIDGMILDRKDSINIANFIQYKPFLCEPNGESTSSGCSPKVSLTLPQCTVVSKTSGICAQICDGVDPDEQDPPEVNENVQMRLTFPPPVPVPQGGADGADAILQASFQILLNRQWQGSLFKYNLNSKGEISSQHWEAGQKLRDRAEATRQIFTAEAGLSDADLNNFRESNYQKLKPLIAPTYTDDEIKKLIRFVRGGDPYGEDASVDERWKLGDSFHSEPVVVRAPSSPVTDDEEKTSTLAYYRFINGYDNFSRSHANRKEVVLLAANDGMLHAFDLADGSEIWAFIPPNVLPNLVDMAASELSDAEQASAEDGVTGKSQSVFLLDQAPVVKDVFVNNQWKTIAIGGLGIAGAGYYALDITDTTTPKFLWAFSRDSDSPSSNTKTWVGAAGPSTTGNFGVLGDAWSKPLILKVPLPSGEKWIALIGGGFNGGKDARYGSAIYAIDLLTGAPLTIQNPATGESLKYLKVGDSSRNLIENSVPARLSAVTSDGSRLATYEGAFVYFVDLEGKSWKLNLTDQGMLWSLDQVLDSEATFENGRMGFFPVSLAEGKDGVLRLFYGTGDLESLMNGHADIDNNVYSIKEKSFPSIGIEDSALTVSDLIDVTGQTELCPAEGDAGWKINLEPGEKVTSKVHISYGNAFFSTYLPISTEECSLGTTKVCNADYQCGNPLQCCDLGRGVSTTPILYRGKIYVGVSGNDQNKDGELDDFTLCEGWQREGNLLVGNPMGPDGNPLIIKGVSVESWFEEF